ncbi:hypothetical protein Hte_010358 [Hypoxylon texense]
MRAIYGFFGSIRYQRPPQLEPGEAKERFVLIQPPKQDLFSGVFSPETVKPAPVGAVWFPAPATRASRRVVLQFIGGALVLGWDVDVIGQRAADIMRRHLKVTNTLVAQYRLAGPKTRFPAATQDVLTVYHYALSLVTSSKDIFLSGDSAGANIVLALLRYLESSQAQLPLPGGATLWSPWVRVAADSAQEYRSLPNSQKDLLVDYLLDWGANAYLPGGDLQREAEPYISPLHHPFRTETPLFIQAGADEAYYDTIKSFADEMSGIESNCHTARSVWTPE